MHLAAVVVGWSLSIALSAQQIEYRKLNGPLAQIVSGDVSAPELSPDGEWVVFLADRDVDERPELYAAPSDGSQPAAKLSTPLGTGSIVEFRITPDSLRVVYRLESSYDELRSAPLDGSTPAVQLNSPPVAHITSFELAANGSRVAFLGSEFTGSYPGDVHSAPLDGSAPSLQLNPPVPSFGNISSYALTPDGARVIYIAGQEAAFVRELYAVPSTGGALVKLSGPPVATADVLDFAVSPDGVRVVYRADQLADETYGLFTAPVDGSAAPLPLTSPAVDATEDYRFGASGRVLLTDGSTLSSVPGDASGPSTLLGNLSGPYRLSPDGTRVVFHSYLVAFDLFLTSRHVDGSSPGLALVSGYVQDDFQVHRDVVLFRRDGLQCVPIDSVQAPVRLDEFPTTSGVTRFDLDREGARAVFVKDQRLFSVPVGHPDGVVELAAGIDGDDAFFITRRPALTHARRTADGRELASPEVVFLREQAYVKELHSTPLDGSRAPLVLNLPFTLTQTVGYVSDFLVDGPWLVYRAQEDEAYVDQLFGQRLDQRGPAVELDGPVYPYDLSFGSIALPSGHYVFGSGGQLLSAPLDGSAVVQLSAAAPGGGVGQFALDAGETRAAFLQATSTFGPQELFVRPVDGSAPAVRLSPAGLHVRDFRLGPDGTHAVYRADPVAGRQEIFSVPLDGSAAPVKLNGPIPQFYEGVRSYGFSPDGLRVVYVATQDADAFYELHSAAIDGSGQVQLAEPPLFDALDHASFEVSTSGFVVYSAEGDTENQVELYGVPLLGGSAPVKLNGPLIDEGDVYRFALTADGSRVVFAADDLVDGREELFSAPVDGVSPAVRLSGITSESCDPEFQLDPIGARVVFRRFAPYFPPGAVGHVFSAPVDGSSAPLALDETISFASFSLLPGVARVLYTKPGPYSAVDLELFLVSTAGGVPVRVNPELQPYVGEVQSFAAGEPGFVYTANQDDPDQLELYQAVITRRAPR